MAQSKCTCSTFTTVLYINRKIFLLLGIERLQQMILCSILIGHLFSGVTDYYLTIDYNYLVKKW